MPGADRDEGEVVRLPAVPVRALGQRRRVHVVLHDQRLAERLPQAVQHRRAIPAGQAAGERHRVAPRIVDTGAADHGLGDRWPGQPGRRAQLVREPGQLGDPAADAGGARPRPTIGPGCRRPGRPARRARTGARCRGRARSPLPAGSRTAARTGPADPCAARRRGSARPARPWRARRTRSASTARTAGPARHGSTGRGPGCGRAAAARSAPGSAEDVPLTCRHYGLQALSYRTNQPRRSRAAPLAQSQRHRPTCHRTCQPRPSPPPPPPSFRIAVPAASGSPATRRTQRHRSRTGLPTTPHRHQHIPTAGPVPTTTDPAPGSSQRHQTRTGPRSADGWRGRLARARVGAPAPRSPLGVFRGLPCRSHLVRILS